jgi:hypothetical protein
VFAYLAYICFSSFIHASVTDPGVSTCYPTEASCITTNIQ